LCWCVQNGHERSLVHARGGAAEEGEAVAVVRGAAHNGGERLPAHVALQVGDLDTARAQEEHGHQRRKQVELAEGAVQLGETGLALGKGRGAGRGR